MVDLRRYAARATGGYLGSLSGNTVLGANVAEGIYDYTSGEGARRRSEAEEFEHATARGRAESRQIPSRGKILY